MRSLNERVRVDSDRDSVKYALYGEPSDGTIVGLTDDDRFPYEVRIDSTSDVLILRESDFFGEPVEE